jgi:hypothetical protein
MLKWVFCALLLVALGGTAVPAGTPPAFFSSDFKNTVALASWKCKPASVWNCDPQAGVNPGAGALHVKPKGDVMRHSAESTFTLKLDHSASVLLSGWVRIDAANYRRDEMATIELEGPGFSSTLREFNRECRDSYLEQAVTLPAGTYIARVRLVFNSCLGEAWFSDIQVRPLAAGLADNPYGGALETASSQRAKAHGEWQVDAPYRIRGKLDAAKPGDPVWADLDFARLLRAAGELNPVDPASVRVFARDTQGQAIECPLAFDYPISSRVDHFQRNGTLKWRATAHAAQYEIYFAPASGTGPKPRDGNFGLGIGELLKYPADEPNLLWTGWAGGRLVMLDIDHDADWDIFVYNDHDGGPWLLRNIGTNAKPLFLPRARPLAGEALPTFPDNQVKVDWDGDGVLDHIFPRKHPRGGYIEGIDVTLHIELGKDGKFTPAVPLLDQTGKPISFRNATWFELNSGDLNNDGRPDLIAGSADGFAELLLNASDAAKRTTARQDRLRFNFYQDDPHESGDMVLKSYPFDWDGDGRQDLVITAWQGYIWLLKNQGAKGEVKFSAPEFLPQQGGVLAQADSVAPCAVDWDGDGDLDLMTASCSGHLMLFENVGTRQQVKFRGGEFVRDDRGEIIFVSARHVGATVQGPAEKNWGYLSCVAADVDRDGDLDLVMGDSLGRVFWLENIGTRNKPSLSHAPHDFLLNGKPLITPWRVRPATRDWTGDGRLEIMSLDDEGNLVRYAQTGGDPSQLSGPEIMRDAKGATIPVNPRSKKTGRGTEGRSQLEVTDWDQDGDFDLVIGGPRYYVGGGNLRLCRNDGTNAKPVFVLMPLPTRGGRFVEWTGSDGHDAWHCSYPTLGDWDGDGTDDLVVGTESGRLAFYKKDYFAGKCFPVFQLLDFAAARGGERIQVLDATTTVPVRCQGLLPSGLQLQLLLDELNPRWSDASKARISFFSPALGAVLKGKVQWGAAVVGVQPAKVDFLLDGKVAASEQTAPYIAFGDDVLWDTRTVPDGDHELGLVVTLFDGRRLRYAQHNRFANGTPARPQ